MCLISNRIHIPQLPQEHLGTATAVSRILELNFQQTLSAFGSAGTQAAGEWKFLSDLRHSKLLHTATPNFNGLLSAYIAREKLTGTNDILGRKRGIAASMADDIYLDTLDQNLRNRWTVTETSFK
jgi:2-methylcitrate dehydratase PrpD